MTTDVAFDVQRQELVTKSGMDSKREAIVRTDTKEVIGVVSKSYKLIPHRELLEKVSQAIEEVGDFQLVKAEITKGGARLFSHYRATAKELIRPEDAVHPELVITNSYDGWLKVGVELGAYRLVCSNGLRVGSTFFEFKHKHVQNLELSEITSRLHESYAHFREKVVPKWREMANGEVPIEETLKRIERLPQIPKKLTKQVLGRATEQGRKVRSAWDLYNDFTYVITHNPKGSYERRRELAREIDRFFSSVN